MAIETTYQPTHEDRINIRPKEGSLKISGDQVFATLQGEGITAGAPSVFIRLQFCNLACGINGGWNCDTGYTWDKTREEYWKEPVDWTYREAAENIQVAWEEKFGATIPEDQKRVVVTGGEPLLQQAKIIEMRKELPGWNMEIETNGTIPPRDELADCQINCSPKLSNSGNPLQKRVKLAALRKINSFKNSWFKFVVTQPSDFAEIDALVEEANLNPEKILIMPEGITVETTSAHLSAVQGEVEKRGWNTTNRNQLIWFGTKRRT